MTIVQDNTNVQVPIRVSKLNDGCSSSYPSINEDIWPTQEYNDQLIWVENCEKEVLIVTNKQLSPVLLRGQQGVKFHSPLIRGGPLTMGIYYVEESNTGELTLK